MSDDLRLQCGENAFHLTHDEDHWEPVTLRSVYSDGHVDYETRTGHWKLRKIATFKAYDPVLKTTFFMPILFNEQQLLAWRAARWERVSSISIS